jgi:hypothetical protein
MNGKIAALAASLGRYVSVLDEEDIQTIIEEELLKPAEPLISSGSPLPSSDADSYQWN